VFVFVLFTGRREDIKALVAKKIPAREPAGIYLSLNFS
jgi:hypothetical protein